MGDLNTSLSKKQKKNKQTMSCFVECLDHGSIPSSWKGIQTSIKRDNWCSFSVFYPPLDTDKEHVPAE